MKTSGKPTINTQITEEGSRNGRQRRWEQNPCTQILNVLNLQTHRRKQNPHKIQTLNHHRKKSVFSVKT